jgi:hypothetical protein
MRESHKYGFVRGRLAIGAPTAIPNFPQFPFRPLLQSVAMRELASIAISFIGGSGIGGFAGYVVRHYAVKRITYGFDVKMKAMEQDHVKEIARLQAELEVQKQKTVLPFDIAKGYTADVLKLRLEALPKVSAALRKMKGNLDQLYNDYQQYPSGGKSVDSTKQLGDKVIASFRELQASREAFETSLGEIHSLMRGYDFQLSRKLSVIISRFENDPPGFNIESREMEWLRQLYFQDNKEISELLVGDWLIKPDPSLR